MEPMRGLISADDHVQEHPEVWTSRMSAAKWGDRVPHVEKQTDDSDWWIIDGQRFPLTGAATAGAGLEDRSNAPRRWADVPTSYYNPKARLQAMDRDGVDHSVLYPTAPGVAGETLAHIADADLRIACVQAYND